MYGSVAEGGGGGADKARVIVWLGLGVLCSYHADGCASHLPLNVLHDLLCGPAQELGSWLVLIQVVGGALARAIDSIAISGPGL